MMKEWKVWYWLGVIDFLVILESFYLSFYACCHFCFLSIKLFIHYNTFYLLGKYINF